MAFDTPLFIFFFLPLSLVYILLFPSGLRNFAVFSVSFIFYAWGEPLFCFAILASAVVDWIGGQLIVQRPRWQNVVVTICILQNVAILIYAKYTTFIFQNLADLFHLNILVPSIALPLGVSFIVFEKITYVVDIRRRLSAPAPNLVDYLAYIFLYPKLIAGPIVKYHEIASQLRHPSADGEIHAAVARVAWGLAKKVLIADSAGEIANSIFDRGVGNIGFCDTWLGALAFSVQIYFDFSAYSDIAIGLARIMGFRLRENFNYPYLAVSFTEFWHRWHISLSTWIREYIYIPLGGSRRGTARTYLNLWISFLISGAWHGASWNFVLWGAYHGSFLVIERLLGVSKESKVPILARRISAFLLVTIGWVLFRVHDVNQAFTFMLAMANPLKWSGDFVYLRNDQLFWTALGLVLIFVPWSATYWRWHASLVESRYFSSLGLATGLIALLVAIGKISLASHSVFLYFRF